MPLIHSKSKSALEQNMRTLHSEIGKSPHVQSRKQAIAIALETQRRGKAEGGKADRLPTLRERGIDMLKNKIGASDPRGYGPPSGVEETRELRPAPRMWMAAGGSMPVPDYYSRQAAGRLFRSGPINSLSGGRTDVKPLSVPAGSYVIPADVVSHLGQNNTAAGMRRLHKLFGGGVGGGMGGRMPGQFRAHGLRSMRSPNGMPGMMHMPRMKMGSMGMGTMAQGGAADDKDPVDIIAAGGEYVLSPEQVGQLGKGNMKAGHDILDDFVMRTRKKHIKALKGLPRPKSG